LGTRKYSPDGEDYKNEVEPFSMEWEFDRGICWTDRDGNDWDGREIYYEIKQEISLYTSKE
jgi:hypothetical protein